MPGETNRSENSQSLDFDAERAALKRLSKHRARPANGQGERLSLRITKIMKPYTKNEGPGISMLQRRWKDLVGERLAKLSYPVKLTGKAENRVLTLEILPSASPIFQHQSEMLKQRLAASSGGFLKDLKFVHKATPGQNGDKARKLRPLSAQERDQLNEGVASVKNPRLSQALLAFGEAVYRQDR